MNGIYVKSLPLFAAAFVALLLTGCTPGATNDGGASPSASKPAVILSMDLAMGLTSGNANGTMPTPSDYDDTWALALMHNAPDVDLLHRVNFSVERCA